MPQFQAIIDGMADALALTDPAGSLIYHNPASLDLHGYADLAEAEQDWNDATSRWEVLDLDGRAVATGDWPLARARRGHDFRDVELRTRHRETGREFIGNYSGSLVRTEDGRPCFAMVTVRDVTARRETEAHLAHQNELLERLFASIPVMLVLWDSRLRKFVLNRHVERTLGWTTDDANRMDFMAAVYPDPAYREQVDAYMQSLAPGWREWVCTARDGSQVPSEWANVRLADDTMIGIGIDVRERRRAEQELAALNESLEERVRRRTAQLERRAEQLARLSDELTRTEQRERGRLARVLHDHLQQLLVGARMGLDGLRRDLAPEHHAAVRKVSDLIGESLRVSRDLTVELSPPILHEDGLAAGLQWLVRWFARTHALHVDLELDGAADEQGDRKVLLFQTARELLLNVVKHAATGRAAMRLARHADQLQLEVSDEGRGFDPASLERDRPEEDGGFGLVSIRERVGLLGGRVTMASSPGRGSRFTVTLPAPAAGSPPTSAGESVPTTMTAQDRRGPTAEQTPIRVLLVDDHVVMRQGLSSLLDGEADIAVIGEAADGHEAVARARALQPDVVLMDFSMPGLNGAEATRIICAELPATRVVGLSMYEDAERGAVMRAAGAGAYLAKSAPHEDLLAVIREHGRRRRQGPATR